MSTKPGTPQSTFWLKFGVRALFAATGCIQLSRIHKHPFFFAKVMAFHLSRLPWLAIHA
jgi:hypothetical protein